MIAKLITSHRIDGEDAFEIAFEINPIDEWKFMRFIDLINAYDTYRKSLNDFKTLMDEIKEDYDKDFKRDDCEW